MKPTARIAWIPLVLIIFTLLGNVSQALADAPTRVTLPFEPTVLPSEFCGFDVLLEAPTNKEKITIFRDKEGNDIVGVITGVFRLRATNLETNTTILFNVPGPGRVEFNADGSLRVTYLGAALLWFPGVSGSEFPGLALTHGRIATEIDTEGTVSIISTHGHIQDACAMLAG